MTAPSLSSAAPQNPAFPPAQMPRSRRFKFLRVTMALMLREIASTDSKVSLGFLWQFLEPVATITLMTVMFQLFSRSPPLGTNFPLFYVTGVMPFSVFQTVGNKVSGCVRFSRPLLEFPAVSVIDAIAARFLLNLIIECSVFVFLVFVVVQAYGLTLHIDFPLAALSLAMGAMLALGVGTFNSVLFVAFPIYEMIWGVVTRPLMLISGVLFQIDSLPAYMQKWLLWNPVLHVVAQMRVAFYPQADGSYVSPLFVFMVSLVTLALGLVTLKRFFRDALER